MVADGARGWLEEQCVALFLRFRLSPIPVLIEVAFAQVPRLRREDDRLSPCRSAARGCPQPAEQDPSVPQRQIPPQRTVDEPGSGGT